MTNTTGIIEALRQRHNAEMRAGRHMGVDATEAYASGVMAVKLAFDDLRERRGETVSTGDRRTLGLVWLGRIGIVLPGAGEEINLPVVYQPSVRLQEGLSTGYDLVAATPHSSDVVGPLTEGNSTTIPGMSRSLDVDGARPSQAQLEELRFFGALAQAVCQAAQYEPFIRY